MRNRVASSPVHRSALAVPLDGSSGTLGALTLYSRQPEAFSKDDLRILLAITSQLGLAIENSLRFREAEDTALTDYLTGLPNARALFGRLQTELEKQRNANGELVIFLIDLDGFKNINDTYGHLTGNSVLKAVASALVEQCRKDDLVARMGGDEFVIVCSQMPTSRAAELSERLTRAVERAGAAELGQSLLSASVGVAFYPKNGTEPEQLLAEADRTMYEKKELGRERRKALQALVDAVGRSDAAYPDGHPRMLGEEQPCALVAHS